MLGCLSIRKLTTGLKNGASMLILYVLVSSSPLFSSAIVTIARELGRGRRRRREKGNSAY